MNPLMLKLIGFVGIAILAASAWFYVQHLRTTVALEKANNAILQETVKTTKTAVDNLIGDMKATKTAVDNLNKEFVEARKDVKALDKKFTETKAGEKRDLNNLAAKHPKLIENAINNGTKEAARCNQLATGAKPETGEKNSVCPSLLQQ